MGLTVNLQKVNSILMLLFMFSGMIKFIIKLTVGYVKKSGNICICKEF